MSILQMAIFVYMATQHKVAITKNVLLRIFFQGKAKNFFKRPSYIYIYIYIYIYTRSGTFRCPYELQVTPCKDYAIAPMSLINVHLACKSKIISLR